LTTARFLSGVRGLETAIYEPRSYPFGYIGPISIIWQATATASQSQPTEVSPATKPAGPRKRKKAKMGNGEDT